MFTIVSYLYDGKIKIKCNEKSMPMMRSMRARPRKFAQNEALVEKEYLEKNGLNVYGNYYYKARGFLESIFPKDYFNYKNVRSLTTFISSMISIVYPREVYRRLKSTMYWIETYIDEINKFLSEHKIEIELNNGEVKQVLPYTKEVHNGIFVRENESMYGKNQMNCELIEPIMQIDLADNNDQIASIKPIEQVDYNDQMNLEYARI